MAQIGTATKGARLRRAPRQTGPTSSTSSGRPPAEGGLLGRLGPLALRAVPSLRRGVASTSGAVAPYQASWQEANALARSGEGPLWVVLGDSTAQGVGASAYDRGYVGVLRERLEARDGRRWRVLNLSRSGARVADVVGDQLDLLAAVEGALDLVTCVVGGNDLLNTPLADAEASFRALIARLPRGSVIGTIPQGLRRPKAVRLNTLIRHEAARAGHRLADVWAHTGAPWRGHYALDQFHPNDAGYRRWADAIWRALTTPREPEHVEGERI